MKHTAFVLLLNGCAPFLFGSSEQQIVDFESERWNIDDPDAEVMFYMNEKSLYLVEGVAHLKDVDFENGVIEVDVAAHGNAGFAGVVFRYQPGGDHEEIYIRPHRSGLPDALQYTPVVNGSAAWQRESGPGYRSVVGSIWASRVPVYDCGTHFSASNCGESRSDCESPGGQ